MVHQRINRKDQHKQQFDENGDIINPRDDDFQQPSDEDAQGNVLTAEEQTLIMMNDSHRTPNKEDTKQHPNHKIKKVPPHLNRTEEDSGNKYTKLIT
jgi:hypothetical protein